MYLKHKYAAEETNKIHDKGTVDVYVSRGLHVIEYSRFPPVFTILNSF